MTKFERLVLSALSILLRGMWGFGEGLDKDKKRWEKARKKAEQ